MILVPYYYVLGGVPTDYIKKWDILNWNRLRWVTSVRVEKKTPGISRERNAKNGKNNVDYSRESATSKANYQGIIVVPLSSSVHSNVGSYVNPDSSIPEIAEQLAPMRKESELMKAVKVLATNL